MCDEWSSLWNCCYRCYSKIWVVAVVVVERLVEQVRYHGEDDLRDPIFSAVECASFELGERTGLEWMSGEEEGEAGIGVEMGDYRRQRLLSGRECVLEE